MPKLPPRGVKASLWQGATMGTSWSVTAYTDEESGLVQSIIERILADLVAQMSHWDRESDLSRYNAAEANLWLEMPDDFVRVLDAALAVAIETEGAFDPGLGEISDHFGFGPGFLAGRAPSYGDWMGISLRRGDQLVLQPGGVRLDFSSIAKGYAVDCVSRALDGLGCVSYLVEIGGECRARGLKDRMQPWWVGIEQPDPSTPELMVALVDSAIATTGDYRRFAMQQGVRTPHTIDPLRRRPAGSGVASISVLHESCMMADAYSTALAVMGVEQGIAWADARGLAVVYCQRGAEDQWVGSREFVEMLT